MLIESILRIYKPDNKLSLDNFVLSGSFPNIVKHVNAIYKELHGFPNHYMGSLLKGVSFVYKGVSEGRQLPPYQWGANCVNTVWKCTDSIRSGVVMMHTVGWNGHTDAPEEEFYLFDITEDGVYQLIINMFSKVEEKIITSHKVISLIKGDNILWEKVKNIPNIDLSVKLGQMGFSD